MNLSVINTTNTGLNTLKPVPTQLLTVADAAGYHPDTHRQTIQTVLLNKCTHRILGISSYRLNTTTILNKLNWLSYHQIVLHESIKLMHRISYESQPPALSQLLYHSLVRSHIETGPKTIG